MTAALLAGGMALAVPAQAANDDKAYAFADPSGTEWRVPSGMSKIVVALRGGNGGAGAGGGYPGGDGADFAVELDVKPGDVLTVYAATNATGKKDHRDGGKGFVNGGTGGKGSVTGKHAGGGGGAAAVKLNGALIAVAGGGGGHGGSASYTDRKNCGTSPASSCESQKRVTNEGGSGGSAGSLRTHPRLGDGSIGSGSGPGAGGLSGSDESNSKGYHAGGQNGSTAGFGTDGGGGGAGGGGWPASGLGGGGGRSFWGSNGGGGGGAGMSWIAPGVREANARAFYFDSRVPVWVSHPSSDAVLPSYAFVPGESVVTLSVDGSPLGLRGIGVKVFASTARTPSIGEQGTFAIYEGSQLLAKGNTNDYVTGADNGRAALFLENTQKQFSPGEHEFRIEFTPNRPELTTSTATLRVTFPTPLGLFEEGEVVEDPTPPALPEAEDSSTDAALENGQAHAEGAESEASADSYADITAQSDNAALARSVPDFDAAFELLDSAEGPPVMIGTAVVLLLGAATALLLHRRRRLQQARRQLAGHDEPEPGDE